MTVEQFIETVHQQRPVLVRLAQGFLHDKVEAEDAVQEALLRMWLLRERIAAHQDFSLLSVRITKNVCISVWRQKQKQPTVALEAIQILEEGRGPSANLEEQEAKDKFHKALHILTPAERRIFLLWQQEMAVREIAALIGIKVRTVSSMLSLARRKLLKSIKEQSL